MAVRRGLSGPHAPTCRRTGRAQSECHHRWLGRGDPDGDLPDVYRQAAAVADKILKGANPSEIPIERPTKFELVANLKTAKAAGFKISESFLIRADEVIE
jgi:hypothetical protein